MKKIFRNSLHSSCKSHDCLIMDIKGKKVKIAYEAYNAVERCNVDFFDGEKWNHIFSMLDMGVQCVPSAYNIWDENKRKKRADDLFENAKKMSEAIL